MPAGIGVSPSSECGLEPDGAGGDERVEGEALPAVLVEQLLHPPRELALGASDERLLRERGERAVRDRARRPDRFHLAGLLHRPKRLDHAVRRLELEAAGA